MRDEVIVEPAGIETSESSPITLRESRTAPGSTCEAPRETRRSIETSMVTRAGMSSLATRMRSCGSACAAWLLFTDETYFSVSKPVATAMTAATMSVMRGGSFIAVPTGRSGVRRS